jgi:ABC-type thiamine transport system ATPase subunit
MSRIKGSKKTGGRTKGASNKVSTETRLAFKLFVENNHSELQGWIERVAETNPAKAIELLILIAGFILPKQGRVTVEDESEKTQNITINYIK